MSNFLINSLKILFELSNEKIIENRQKFAYSDFWHENSDFFSKINFLKIKFSFKIYITLKDIWHQSPYFFLTQF